MMLQALPILSLILTVVSTALPIARRPVVIWHGLGDSYDSEGMNRVSEVIKKEYPGIYVHSVYLDESSSTDSRMSFFGSVNDEITQVCEQLAGDPLLADGFDAVGFSQGGLFLRGYIERCNNPPVKKLISFGSPHNGVADLPSCGATDFWCQQRNWLMKTQLWSNYVQDHVVAAQYFRDPERLDTYLENSHFLADINNEREEKNATYRDNLASLDQLVLIMFTLDETLVPKESAWMQEVNRTSGVVTPLEHRDMYKQDWIGVKRLVDEELVDYVSVKGVHMEVSDATVRRIAKQYLGSAIAPRFLLTSQH